MKKVILAFLLLLMTLSVSNVKTKATSDYLGFEEIILESGKLLSNYTDAEYDEYYQKINKTKFWGWNVHIVNNKVPCTYIARTVYETTNSGEEAITYEISVTTETEVKTIISATGSISYGLSGSVNKFKHDLDAEVGLEYKYQITEGQTKTEKLKVPVEGKTKLLVTVTGTGYVTNGVAAYYMFWMCVEKGGFEYFTITSEYQTIEKVAI